MPESPNRPTNRVPGPSAIPGEHAGEHNAVAAILNGIYKRVVAAVRAANFTVTQSMQAEIVPINSASSVTVTVPVLEIGTVVELVQVGAGGVTLASSGVGFLPELPPAGAAPGTIITLSWLTPTQVLARVVVPPAGAVTPQPTSLLAETFTGADGAAWPTTRWTTGLVPTLGGGATIQGNAGQLQTGRNGGYSSGDRITKPANLASLADFDARFRIRLDASEHYANFAYRCNRSDLDSDTGFFMALNSIQATLALTRSQSYAGSVVNSMTSPLTSGAWYRVRIRVVGNAHKVKIWADAATEPATWGLEATHAATDGGFLGFAGSGGGAASVTQSLIDDVTITAP